MINVERRGAGEPIVLLHGIGSRWQCFEPILDRLAAHHEVIAIDLPGFGGSPIVDGVEPGPWGYVRWLPEWLADNGIERPHLVGSSMGAGVALELGRRGVASSVTAFSPIGFWGRPGLRWTQTMLTALWFSSRKGAPVLDRLVEYPAGRVALLSNMFGHPTRLSAEMARGDLAGLAGSTGFTSARSGFGRFTFRAEDGPGSLPDIPVTIAWGTRDVVLIHRTQSARAREVFPFVRHVDLPGCGHLPFNDDPAACARLVLDDAAATKESR